MGDVEDIDNSSVIVMVVGNNIDVTGRITKDEKKTRNRRMQRRGQQRKSLMNYDIHRARKE